MGVRRKAREMALQALYAMDLTNLWEEDFSEFLYEKERWPSSADHASKILSGVLAHHQPIDEALQRQGLRILARMIARQHLNTMQPHKEGQTDHSEESGD